MDWQAILIAFIGNPFAIVSFFVFLAAFFFFTTMRRDMYLDYKLAKQKEEYDNYYKRDKMIKDHQLALAEIHNVKKVKEALNSYGGTIVEEPTFHPYPPAKHS